MACHVSFMTRHYIGFVCHLIFDLGALSNQSQYPILHSSDPYMSYVSYGICLICHGMVCHGMSCHVMAWHVMSYHVMSCHVMSCHVMSCHVMSCHLISSHLMASHVISCHLMSCHCGGRRLGKSRFE